MPLSFFFPGIQLRIEQIVAFSLAADPCYPAGRPVVRASSITHQTQKETQPQRHSLSQAKLTSPSVGC